MMKVLLHPAADVDWQVWEALTSQITGHEDILSKQAAKMLGQEDILLWQCCAAN